MKKSITLTYNIQATIYTHINSHLILVSQNNRMASKVLIVVFFLAMVTMFVASNIIFVKATNYGDLPYYNECYENGIKSDAIEDSVRSVCRSIAYELEN